MDDDVLDAVLVFGILGLFSLGGLILVCKVHNFYFSLVEKILSAVSERLRLLFGSAKHTMEDFEANIVHKDSQKTRKRTTIVVATEVPLDIGRAQRKNTMAAKKSIAVTRVASNPEEKLHKIISPELEVARNGSGYQSNPVTPMTPTGPVVFIMPRKEEERAHKPHSVVTAQTSSEASSQDSTKPLHRCNSM